MHVQLRVDALGKQVERQGDHIHVAGPLAVAEQGALDPVRAGQLGQLGGRDRGAPVVVGVDAEHDGVPVGDVPAEPLDHVGVGVGPVHLDGVGQVDDHLAVGGRLDHVHDRGADLDREVGLGAGEALRASTRR